jgi:hypothetical protein
MPPAPQFATPHSPAHPTMTPTCSHVETSDTYPLQVIEQSLADIQAANAANVLGSGVLTSLQLGPDFTMRLPSLNLRNPPPSNPASSPSRSGSTSTRAEPNTNEAGASTTGSPGVAENAAAAANGAHPCSGSPPPLLTPTSPPMFTTPQEGALRKSLTAAGVVAASTAKSPFFPDAVATSDVSEDTVGCH